jgi:heat shock protein 90kDa beta
LKTEKKDRSRFADYVYYLGQHSFSFVQIFYLAEIGRKPEELAQSVFIEKLDARGYEVLLLNEPLDEILLSNLREWK